RSINLFPGSNFEVMLNGTAVGSQYSQQNVTGAVADGPFAILNVALGYTPMPGDKFTIINNDSTDAVSGAFNGPSEGTVFTQPPGSFTGTFQITYQGGDGNDVVLTAIDPANPTIQGTSGDDNWLVSRNGNNEVITLNGTQIWSTPFSSLTGLTLDGLDGHD